MQYEDILPISREQLHRALTSESEEHAARAIIAVGLYEPDWRWAEQTCVQALQDSREDVRAAAITSLGHIARIHGRITVARVIPELEGLRSHPTLGGVAEDALEDILRFVKSPGPE